MSSDFVSAFLKNKDDARFRKALSVLKQSVEKDCPLFPELTKKQVMKWITPMTADENTRIQIKCLIAILTEEKLRMQTFGF